MQRLGLYTTAIGLYLVALAGCGSFEPESKHGGGIEAECLEKPPDVEGLTSSVDVEAAWSPQGDLIAYVHHGNAVGRYPSPDQLWLINPSTRDRRYVRSGVLEAAWFPSGDSLVVTMVDRNLYVVGLDGVIKQQLTFDGNENWFADVSPSGERVVYDKGFREVHVLDLPSRVDREIGSGSGSTRDYWRSGSWSPTGSRIAHIRFGGENPASSEDHEAIYLMDSEGGNAQRVTFGDSPYSDPKWSPRSGRYLAYVGSKCPPLFDIFLLDLATGRSWPLTEGGALWPSWSPDERWIVYAKQDPFRPAEEGNMFLHTLDLTTGKQRQLTFASDYHDASTDLTSPKLVPSYQHTP